TFLADLRPGRAFLRPILGASLMSHIASLVLSLSLAGAPDPEITDVRVTHGFMGAKLEKPGRLPGDNAFFAFNVKNLTLNKAGQAEFTMLLEIRDPKGEIVSTQGPRNMLVQNFFGGDSVPCHANMAVPLDAEPGNYSLNVVITDKATGKKASFTGKGKVLPRDF